MKTLYYYIQCVCEVFYRPSINGLSRNFSSRSECNLTSSLIDCHYNNTIIMSCYNQTCVQYNVYECNAIFVNVLLKN